MKVDGSVTGIGRYEPAFRRFVIIEIVQTGISGLRNPVFISGTPVGCHISIQFRQSAVKRSDTVVARIDSIVGINPQLSRQRFSLICIQLPGIKVPAIGIVVLEGFLFRVVRPIQFVSIPGHTEQSSQRCVVAALHRDKVRELVRIITEAGIIALVRSESKFTHAGVHILPLFVD